MSKLLGLLPSMLLRKFRSGATALVITTVNANNVTTTEEWNAVSFRLDSIERNVTPTFFAFRLMTIEIIYS